ncbi:MAG: alpha/beta fold hydrolase [Gemmatimonadetes bacterium]|nr:alpha/beta fold hydrolase [Gemmatimonadota bacterium]
MNRRSVRSLARTTQTHLVALVCLATMACTPVPRDDGDRASDETLGPPDRYTVEVDGHPMAVWGRTPANVEAVALLLHGRTWSSIPDFDLQAPGEDLSLMRALADRGIAVYALDARGYGATPRDSSGWLTPNRMAADAAGVLEWIRARHPDLPAPAVMGWSYGATVAHLTAQRNPESVSGVALYGYVHHPERLLPEVEQPAAAPRRPTTDEAARSDFITPGSISATAIEAFVDAALTADPIRVDLRAAHEFNALAPDSLIVPTLILQGELDPFAPTVVQDALFGGLGTAHKAWVVLPGCDHAAHIERCMPRFVRALSGFVHEVAGR